MQAPGGRSSFTFDDGSSRQPVPSNYNHAASRYGAVPPGGHLSFHQPPVGIMDRNSTRVQAAPGGRSSLSLTDGSGSTPFEGRSGAPPPLQYNQQASRGVLGYYSQPMSHDPYAQQHHHAPPHHCSQPQGVQPHQYGQMPQMPSHGQYYSPSGAPHAPSAVTTAPLYCNEGGVHQGRSSTRVAAPPGGHSSFSFAYHSPAPPAVLVPSAQDACARPAAHQRQQPFGSTGDSLTEHVAQVRSRSNSRNTQEIVQSPDRYLQPRYPDGSTHIQAPAPAAEMLYCGEGGVIRGRASTRVAAPPGGHSSFSLGWGPAESAAKPGGYMHPRNVLPTSGRATLVLG